MVTEFFVLRKVRRQGIDAHLAWAMFDRFPGRWEIAELPQNTTGLAFWRKTIGGYAQGH